MRHVWNAHAGRADDQTSDDIELIQEHGDADKAEVCGSCESVRKYGVQPEREERRRDY